MPKFMPPDTSQSTTRKSSVHETLLQAPLQVVNMGLDTFAEDLASQKVPVVRLDWSPPREMDAKLAGLLKKLGM